MSYLGSVKLSELREVVSSLEKDTEGKNPPIHIHTDGERVQFRKWTATGSETASFYLG